MTKITIVKHDGKYRGFECQGHSGYAESGEDVVCAAISVLTLNTINSIDHFLDDEISVTTNEEDGVIQCYFMGELSEGAKLLMDSLEFGLISIANQYGEQYIKVETEEV
jgi:uncharacterized protein YsxB (DUF464 family)